ncbi:MAG: UvrD-helicase domain-containing protein [Candidatus Blackburnbacteria bacterium]|nr:UvrD-helicase domain-containing protein [Candidatus Blackburnbacteria bacterium]
MAANSILADLNPNQQAAVKYWGSPLLILAGAGSGKTKVLTHRAAWLIQENKIHPASLLAITFTNKAAGEMKERITNLIGTTVGFAGTFHAFCARLLRQYGSNIGIDPDFVIYDTTDQLDAVKDVMSRLGLGKSFKPGPLISAVSQAKNELVTASEFAQYAQGDWQRKAALVFLEYQRLLKDNHALDFDDLLTSSVKLLTESSETLQRLGKRFQYILVDEWQDTNKAQYEIVRLLAQANGNQLTVVGDAAQCLPLGTKVATINGEKSIEKLKLGELVLAAAGRGKTHSVPINNIKVSKYKGDIFSVRLRSGRSLELTPNHILFARLNKQANKYYVYLMFRKDKGYRIGIATASRVPHKGRSAIGLLVRSVQEQADKMWVLKVCDGRASANFWEHWFVVKYGIPSLVFSTKGRNMALTQEQINTFYSSIDTRKAAERLFQDLLLFNEYPHHRPKGIASDLNPDRQLVRFTLFSDKRPSERSPWCGHRVSINTSNREIERMLIQKGYETRKANRNTWRIERCNWRYETSLTMAENIASAAGGVDINHSALIVDDKRFLFTPASHLRETMEVGVLEDNLIVVDEIVSIEKRIYEGKVYDLDVQTLHNYIAEGVVVHNSIYSWRGANYRNITALEKDFENLKIINLDQNYRSTQVILDAAYGVINKNKNHPILKLWTENPAGNRIKLYQARSEMDEASFVVRELKNLLAQGFRYADIAVLYRINAQSRALEEAFLHEGIPYTLIGGVRFYDRREVKDVLAYLKLLANPNDSISRKRAESLGKRRFAAYKKLQEKLVKDQNSTLELLDQVLEATSYMELYDKNNPEDQARLENIKELRSVATEFPKLVDFLEQVALVETVQEPKSKFPAAHLQAPERSDGGRVTLMTAHAAKGLEFPTVFIVGLEEGLFPHSRALTDQEELEEERRLAYVGITRAKKQLYLTFASKRLLFGQSGTSYPSRFLSEIPEKLVENLQGNLNSWQKDSFDDFFFADDF